MGSACGKLHTSHCNATSVGRYHFNRLPAQPAHLSDTLFIYDSKTLHFSSLLNSQDMLLKVILILLATCVLFSSVAVDTSDDTAWQMWIISTINIYCHNPILSDIITRLLYPLEYQRFGVYVLVSVFRTTVWFVLALGARRPLPVSKNLPHLWKICSQCTRSQII